GAGVPASMRGVVLEAEIAGQRTTREFAPSSDLRTSLSWDGRDEYGRPVQGVQVMRARLGYVYQGAYRSAMRFAGQGDSRITGSRARQQVTLWAEATALIGTWDARPQGLGGFGIASHHAYDPESGTLFLGDGTRRSARNVAAVLVEVADRPPTGFVTGMVMADDGTLYIGTSNGRVFRTRPYGQPSLLLSIGWGLHGMVVAPDGTLYVTDGGRHHVVAVAPDGATRIVAGGGQDPSIVPGGGA